MMLQLCQLESPVMNYINTRQRAVYQDVRDSSHHYRASLRTYHPVTERQNRRQFMVGDSVRMRILSVSSKYYMDMNIINILPYNTVKQVLGSYNIDDSFNGHPFTHVLVLSSF